MIDCARARSIAAALAIVAASSGCRTSADRLDEAAAHERANQHTVERGREPQVAELAARPATSSATSATEVLTFRSVLEDRQMTRENRIRALQDLDPGALQKPVARPNVSGGPSLATESKSHATTPAPRAPAAAHRRVPVVMYSTSWCGVCKKARDYFEERRIAFEEHDVDEDRNARAEYLKLNPRRSVPTIKIGDEVIVGFSAAAVERALDSAVRL